MEVKDLYLAGYLYASGLSYKGTRREGKTCWFNFDDWNRCQQLQQEYIAGIGTVNAKGYSDALRTLKGVIFDSD